MNRASTPPSETHLDAEAVYALLDGRLDVVAERTAEAHLWRCGRCRILREECAALLSSLRWYAADPPAPPEGYWDEFWRRLPLTRGRRRRFAPALALAASIAMLLAIEPGAGPGPEDSTPIALTGAAAPGPEWASDYRLFEQATVAIGSADPLSKGIILASLVEPR